MRRRASVLVTVLVVLVAATLVAGTVLLNTRVALGESAAYDERAAVRAAARSAVRAWLWEGHAQRETLLGGGSLALTDRLEVDRVAGSGVLVARVVSVNGRATRSEAGRLDLRSATAGALAALPSMDDQMAQAIRSALDAGGVDSIYDLGAVDAVSLDMLFGEPGEEPVSGELFGENEPAGLIEQVGLFASDPAVTAGADPAVGIGQGRFDVNQLSGEDRDRWDADEIDQRLGQGAFAGLARYFDNGGSGERLADVLAALERSSGDATAFEPAVDTVTVHRAGFVRGRVDINRAPAAVIAALGPLSEEDAGTIIDARERVDDETKRTILWPSSNGEVARGSLMAAADQLAVRSMQWRVRFETGWERSDENGEFSLGSESRPEPPAFSGPDAGSGFGSDVGPDFGLDGADRAQQLRHRSVIEVVIDLAGGTPRVASIVDLTGLDRARERVTESREGAALLDSTPAVADDDDASFEPDDLAPPVSEPVRPSGRSSRGSRDDEGSSASGGGPSASTGRAGRWMGGGG